MMGRTWRCRECDTYNDVGEGRCLACDTPRPRDPATGPASREPRLPGPGRGRPEPKSEPGAGREVDRVRAPTKGELALGCMLLAIAGVLVMSLIFAVTQYIRSQTSDDDTGRSTGTSRDVRPSAEQEPADVPALECGHGSFEEHYRTAEMRISFCERTTSTYDFSCVIEFDDDDGREPVVASADRVRGDMWCGKGPDDPLSVRVLTDRDVVLVIEDGRTTDEQELIS
jgi:hypothetical protein